MPAGRGGGRESERMRERDRGRERSFLTTLLCIHICLACKISEAGDLQKTFNKIRHRRLSSD